MPRLSPIRWFVILTVIAVLLAIGLPPNPKDLQELDASATAYRLAIAVLLIPYILVWYAAFYAFAKLSEYSASIRGSKDGEAFRKITIGMGALSFSLIIPTMISLILNYLSAREPSFEPASVIITNYAALFPGMISFLLLLNGTRLLLRTIKGGTHKIDLRWHAPWFLLLSVAFSYLTFEAYRDANPYHLPLLLLITTFIVPYLYGWTVGLMSGYYLHLYASTVKGQLYRKGISQFANGILVAILGSVAIQFVNITFMQKDGNSLGIVLLISYILVGIVAVGLLLMAFGTRKLKLIEEA